MKSQKFYFLTRFNNSWIVFLEESLAKLISDNGFITDFSTMIKLSKACIDIVEVLVIGCEGKNKIPKPYKTPNWEDNCAVIISKEDGSLWQLFSINEDIMDAFYLLR